MKIEISKEEYEALSDEMKKAYKAHGKGFKLDIDDSDIAAEARRAKEREKQRADEAEAKVSELEERLSKLEGDDARKRGDIAAIEKSWEKKLKEKEEEFNKKEVKLKDLVEKTLIDHEIDTIANDIFVKPKRDGRLIRDRVYVEWDKDGNPILRVKDKEGKPSALKLEDLRKETVDNDDFKDILSGSKASGSGGAGGNQGGGAPKQPKDMTEAERINLYRTNPAKFRELFPQALGPA